MTTVQFPLPSLAGRNEAARPETTNYPLVPTTNISAYIPAQRFPTKSLRSEASRLNLWQPEYGLSPRLRNFRKDEPVLVGRTAAKGKKLEKDKEEVVAKDLPQVQVNSIITKDQSHDIDATILLPHPPLNPVLDKASVLPDFKNKNSTEIGTAIFSNVWENMKKMMGFSPDCLHGGHKNLRGNCVCPKYYEGNLCESIVCTNNGTRKKAASSFTEEICVCPYPDFVSGKHCEVLRCHNGGKDMGNGHCSCVDGWYSGQFCQFYTSSWLVAVGLPLLGIAMIIICCVVCRLDLCPRRSSRRERRQRRRNQASLQQQPPRNSGNNQRASAGRSTHISTQLTNHPGFAISDQDLLTHEHNLIIQENLLNEGMIRQLNGRQYVVRLEQVPNFNPGLVLSMESNVPTPSYKPMEPPPSYDQAVHCAHVNRDSLPPNYSPPHSSCIFEEHNRPLLPRFRAPNHL